MAASMGQVRREERRLDSLYDNTGRLGMVVGGSLARGVEVRLDGDVSVEDLAVGRFVTIQGRRRRFFGILTDIALANTDESISSTPPDVSDPFIAGVVSGTNAFGTVHVTPYLSLGAEEQVGDGPLPAKTIPPHFSLVRESDASEVQLVFGENDARHIWVGSPLDMGEAPVCLDVTRLVERSTGVFGKTGTGKSFLTRILLAEMVQKSEAVSLVFDMHGEYGWQSRAERGERSRASNSCFSRRSRYSRWTRRGLASGGSAPTSRYGSHSTTLRRRTSPPSRERWDCPRRWCKRPSGWSGVSAGDG